LPGFKRFKIKQSRNTSRVFAGRSIGRVRRSGGFSGGGRPRRRLFDGVDQAKLAKVIKVAAFVALVGVFLWVIIGSANSGGTEIAMSLAEADTSRPITPEDGQTEGSSKMTIALGGNIKLQSEVLDAAGASNNNFNNYLYEMGALMDADLSVVNLMGSIGSEGSAVSAYPSAQYPAELAQALGAINVNAAITANRQTMLYGPGSLTATTQALGANGIACLGTSAEGGQKWQVIDYNGIKIGIGAYHCATKAEITELENKQKAAGASQEQIDACINQLCIDIIGSDNGKDYSEASKTILADVKTMRENGAEIVIVLLNWGSDGQTEPNSAMKTLAQRMIDAKVDITVGYGPDVLEKVTVKEVETDRGTKKKCYVFYSMGNLFSDCDKGATARKYESMVVKFDVVKTAEDTVAVISSGSVYPVYINRDPAFVSENTQRKYLVVPAGLYEYKAEGSVRPSVFTTDDLWNRYTSTFTHVRTAVQNTWDVDKYLSLGSVTRPQDTQQNQGGSSDSTNM